jgi:hypothetical protein
MDVVQRAVKVQQLALRVIDLKTVKIHADFLLDWGGRDRA